MICRTCRHCGLCQGDGKIQQESLSVEAGLWFCESPALDAEAASFGPSCFGIAIDVGTTTVAATAWSFSQGKLCQANQPNGQRIFGADLISRLSYSTVSNGYDKLRQSIILQLEQIVCQLYMEVSTKFLSLRQGRPELKRLVLTGNTSMLSFIRGVSVEGLCAFPFTYSSLFGETVSSSEVFDNPASSKVNALWETVAAQNFSVTFAPCVSAFVGGDTTCAMLACGFFNDDGRTKFLADVGTNCEMAVVSAEGKIVCTSSSAGPAFEGHGISCGMAASEGAIVSVEYEDSPSRGEGKFNSKVIGGVEAKGVCGTGLLSAMAEFYRKGFINSNGTFWKGVDHVAVAPGVSLNQKDVRNFQLAKAAVYSGLEYLEKEVGSNSSNTEDSCLFLSGGFGTKLNPRDACDTRMIPAFLSEHTVSCGNAALSGAVMILLNQEKLILCKQKSMEAKSLDLALMEDFQNSFISALNF